jgi:hypothetical protein
MDAMTGREYLHTICRTIFHVVARASDMDRAEQQIVELLHGVIHEALASQKEAIVDAVVTSLGARELPHCNCGKRYVNSATLLQAVKNAFDSAPKSIPEVN